MEVVVEAAGFVAGGLDQGKQQGAQVGFLARPGGKEGDDGDFDFAEQWHTPASMGKGVNCVERRLDLPWGVLGTLRA
jgi:hypothetical protein